MKLVLGLLRAAGIRTVQGLLRLFRYCAEFNNHVNLLLFTKSWFYLPPIRWRD